MIFMVCLRRFVLAALPALLLCLPLIAEENTEKRIVFLPIIDSTEEEALANTGSHIHHYLEKYFNLLDGYSFKNADYFVTDENKEYIGQYLEDAEFDIGIYGEIVPIENRAETRLTLYAYSREEEGISVEQSAALSVPPLPAETIEKLAVDLVEAISGEAIGFGTLFFRNTGAQGSYTVYVDGGKRGEDLNELKVFRGEHVVEIRQKTEGDEELLEVADLTLAREENYTIEFALYPPGKIDELKRTAEAKEKDLENLEQIRGGEKEEAVYRSWTAGQSLELGAAFVKSFEETAAGGEFFAAWKGQLLPWFWIGIGSFVLYLPEYELYDEQYGITYTQSTFGAGLRLKLLFGNKSEGFAIAPTAVIGVETSSSIDYFHNNDITTAGLIFGGGLGVYFRSFFLDLVFRNLCVQYHGEGETPWSISVGLGYSFDLVREQEESE
jgi:hypothetical protein